jgi:hypothetical protein
MGLNKNQICGLVWKPDLFDMFLSIWFHDSIQSQRQPNSICCYIEVIANCHASVLKSSLIHPIAGINNQHLVCSIVDDSLRHWGGFFSQ